MKASNAQLVIGCRSGRLFVFLSNLSSVVSYDQDEATVTLRFDAEPHVEIRARVSRPGGDAVLLTEQERLITSIRSHKRLEVSLVPHCLKPQELVFDLGGLNAVLDELPRRGCPIQTGQR